jgi:hypothetical protein
MPLYEIDESGELTPFRRLRGGADLYESELEDLVWASPDEFLGETLFRIARQANLPTGGRVDVVCLDRSGRVVILEIKRDVERSQLAQCLEYAGWARATNLDELAGLYHRGPEAFFDDWQEFTDSAAPVIVNRSPRLVLIARSFHERTEAALSFLIENGLPVTLIPVTIYEDQQRRRLVDVEGEHEPEFLAPATPEGSTTISLSETSKINGRRIRLSDLLEAGLLVPDDELVWERPRLGVTYRARVTENGAIELEDGRRFPSPSKAAIEAAEIPAYDGWLAWHVSRRAGIALHDLRAELVAEAHA